MTTPTSADGCSKSSRTEPTENIPVLKRLLALRYEFAASLGYPGYAAYALEDKMMQTPVAAAAFLHRIGDLTRPAALQDLAQLLERKRKDDPAATGSRTGTSGSSPTDTTARRSGPRSSVST